jgi:chaperonin GroES
MEKHLEKLQEFINDENIAASLDEDKLIEIGQECKAGYESDLKSRAEFERMLDQWTELAMQVAKKRSYPWDGASNIKYPLLSTAAMQFAARAYPSLVPSNGQVVRFKTVGNDPDGSKMDRAKRLGKYMSYQILDEMEEWEEEMDKLLLALPIVGTVFKKTYWDNVKQRNYSCLILPKQLVVNYWAKTLEDAERITETMTLSKRKLREKQLAGIYLDDIKLGDPQADSDQRSDLTSGLTKPDQDNTTPYMILEQHTYLDLDEDGYAEPYIVTLEEQSGKVLRIVARFTQKGVILNEANELIRIDPTLYYTKYSFVPNPDGGFYDIGFGRLLGSLNDSADTLINQLVDAGSLSNLQAGFIGKGLRIKMGQAKFKPGEWKEVNATGDDIKKQVFPLPVREPSPVLMQLLQFLIQSGKELASVAEIFVGKMPGQNTPATTTMATIEQGMKVFTAVYKRIFRSLTKEFRKLYLLNREYANPQEYISVLDVEIQQSDFEGSEDDLVPAADPQATTGQEKQAKVEALGKILQLGTLNPMEFTKYYLEAYEIPAPERFIMQPQPAGPSPEQQQAQLEAQIAQQESQQKMQVEEHKLRLQSAAAAQKAQLEAEASKRKIQEAAIMGDLKSREIMANANAKLQQGNMQHAQKMIQSQQSHAVALQQQKEKKAATPAKPKKG